jgi:hypothetical protein
MLVDGSARVIHDVCNGSRNVPGTKYVYEQSRRTDVDKDS